MNFQALTCGNCGGIQFASFLGENNTGERGIAMACLRCSFLQFVPLSAVQSAPAEAITKVPMDLPNLQLSGPAVTTQSPLMPHTPIPAVDSMPEDEFDKFVCREAHNLSKGNA